MAAWARKKHTRRSRPSSGGPRAPRPRGSARPGAIPAMLPSTSRRPNWSTAAATVATHSSRPLMSPVGSRRRAGVGDELGGLRDASALRSWASTCAPSPVRRSATARPMPEPAPVTSATLPSKRSSISCRRAGRCGSPASLHEVDPLGAVVAGLRRVEGVGDDGTHARGQAAVPEAQLAPEHEVDLQRAVSVRLHPLARDSPSRGTPRGRPTTGSCGSRGHDRTGRSAAPRPARPRPGRRWCARGGRRRRRSSSWSARRCSWDSGDGPHDESPVARSSDGAMRGGPP